MISATMMIIQYLQKNDVEQKIEIFLFKIWVKRYKKKKKETKIKHILFFIFFYMIYYVYLYELFSVPFAHPIVLTRLTKQWNLERIVKNLKLYCLWNCHIYKIYATKSNGLLNPPFLFIYCLYFLLRITCTAPTSFPSTFLPLVVSKPQKPIILIISCSSGVFP